jgi:hypothetical protein
LRATVFDALQAPRIPGRQKKSGRPSEGPHATRLTPLAASANHLVLFTSKAVFGVYPVTNCYTLSGKCDKTAGRPAGEQCARPDSGSVNSAPDGGKYDSLKTNCGTQYMITNAHMPDTKKPVLQSAIYMRHV